MTTHTTTLSLSLGGDTPTWEGEATVSYSVTWGGPETPPAYSHGGLPADPDLVEDVTVTHIDGRIPGAGEAEMLENHIECDDRLMAELLTHAAEESAERHAGAMEYRREVER